MREEEAVRAPRGSAPCAPGRRRGRRRSSGSGRACSRARGTRRGSTIRSADEWEMSRSCQSGMFSSPTTAAPRTTRARPEIRSATFGFRLCGIADEPFMPVANGSSTSRTSVRARCRISVANRSSDDAQIASVDEQLGVPVARDHLRRDRIGLEAEPLARDPLDLGVDRRVRPDGARRAGRRGRPRAPGERGRAPGRARTPSRRASSRTSSARRGSRASGRCRSCGGAPRRARTTDAERAVEPCDDSAPASLDLQGERGVDDVRRRQPVVDPAAFRAELLGDRVDERGEVVVGRQLDLGDPLRRRHASRPPRIAATSSAGTDADLGPASSAASSTSSQRASLPSSDQIRLISGRE